MQILTEDEVRFLIRLGFSACANSKVFHAQNIFTNLNKYDDNLSAAKIGLAFCFIVTDKFNEALDILYKIVEQDNSNYEAYAFIALALALQKDGKALDYINKVPSDEACFALCQNALEILKG